MLWFAVILTLPIESQYYCYCNSFIGRRYVNATLRAWDENAMFNYLLLLMLFLQKVLIFQWTVSKALLLPFKKFILFYTSV